MDSKTTLLYLAGLAEESERYDEMFCIMCSVIEEYNCSVTVDDIIYLQVSYDYTYNLQKDSLQKIEHYINENFEDDDEEDDEKSLREMRLAEQCQDEILAGMQRLCNKMLDLFDVCLIPIVRDQRARIYLFMYKAKVLTNLFRFSTSQAQLEFRMQARTAYCSACILSALYLPILDVLRLTVLLNFISFMSEVMCNTHDAVQFSYWVLQQVAEAHGAGQEPSDEYGTGSLIEIIGSQLHHWLTDDVQRFHRRQLGGGDLFSSNELPQFGVQQEQGFDRRQLGGGDPSSYLPELEVQQEQL